MIASERRHHRAASLPGRHDRPAHCVPDVHEAHRARSIGADAFDGCASRPKRREIMTDAAAGLHRQCRFLDAVEDARQVIGDFAQDKAVEQRDVTVSAGPGQNPARRLKAEIGHRVVKRRRPLLLLAFAAFFNRSLQPGRRGGTCPRSFDRRERWPSPKNGISAARWHRKLQAARAIWRSSEATVP